MKKSFVLSTLALLLGLFFYHPSQAQEDKSKRPSPPDSVTGTIGSSTITINYSSPSVKGRKVWGSLVPYDSVWRAGANEATTFETTKDIKVQGKNLPAGKYALFVIPTKSEWTIIFNKVSNQWGAYSYKKAEDQLRVTASPRKAAFHERLTYTINKNGFSLFWENTEVPVKVD